MLPSLNIQINKASTEDNYYSVIMLCYRTVLSHIRIRVVSLIYCMMNEQIFPSTNKQKIKQFGDKTSATA